MEPGEIIGDVWHFTALDCHALLTALNRLWPFLDQNDLNLQMWRQSLETSYLQATPFDTDRVLFELVAAAEIAYLWNLGSDIKLPCRHSTDDHLRILRSWNDRMILHPKKFAAARHERNEAFNRELERRRNESH